MSNFTYIPNQKHEDTREKGEAKERHKRGSKAYGTEEVMPNSGAIQADDDTQQFFFKWHLLSSKYDASNTFSLTGL